MVNAGQCNQIELIFGQCSDILDSLFKFLNEYCNFWIQQYNLISYESTSKSLGPKNNEKMNELVEKVLELAEYILKVPKYNLLRDMIND